MKNLTMVSFCRDFVLLLGIMALAVTQPLLAQNTYSTPPYTARTLAGTAGVTGSMNGTGAAAQFNGPTAVAVDGNGNTYVADANNGSVRKITPEGVVTILATGFSHPEGVAVDKSGNVYFSDFNLGAIYKITPGIGLSLLAGSPNTYGSNNSTTATNATFYGPTGLAVDTSGNVYVADTFNQLIRMITPSGAVSTLAGTAGVRGTADGDASTAQFGYPYGVAVDTRGNVFVADTYNMTLREISGGSVLTINGAGGGSGSKDGLSYYAQFYLPYGIAVDANENLYIADSGNNTIRIITNEEVTTLAGVPGTAGSTDGNGASAEFSSPEGVAADGNGNVYVADTNNNTIRELLPDISLASLATISPVVGQSFALDITESSGEPVSYYSVLSGPAVVSGVDANIVTFTGTSSVVIGLYAKEYYGTGVPTGGHGIQQNNVVLQASQPLQTAADSVALINISGPATTAYGAATPFTITMQDPYGNTVVGCTDTFQFSSTDGAAVLPGASTLTNGVGVFNLTFNTLGYQTLTVTDATTGVQGVFSPLYVGQATQTISPFTTISPVTYGVAPFTISPPTANSGMQVSYSASGPASISADGTTITITGAGTVTLFADQAGNADYSAAQEVTTSFTVNPAPLTITANNISKIYGQTYTFSGSEFASAGLVNGDAISSVTLTSSGADGTANVYGSPYAIVPSNPVATEGGTFNPANYAITFANGQLTVNPVTYSNWADQKFSAVEQNRLANPGFIASNSTPFHDGVSNLLKYVFDIDPSEAMDANARADLPSVGTATNTTTNKTYLTLTYVQYGGLPSTMLPAVQTSSDLNNWTTVVPDFTTSTPLPNGDIKTEVEVQMNDSGPQFIRLNVSGP